MPRFFKRKFKRKFKRRFKRKRKKRMMSRIIMRRVSRPSLVMPDVLLCPMKAILTGRSILVGTVTNGTQFGTVSGNNLLDPYLDLGSGQPMGFDQLVVFYNRWIVNGSALHIRFLNANSSTGLYMSINPTATSTVPTLYGQLAEQPYAKSKQTGIGSDMNVVSQFISTKKVFGESHLDEEYAGSGSSPNKQWFWHIAGKSGDGSTTPLEESQVTITYYVKFYQRKQLGQS